MLKPFTQLPDIEENPELFTDWGDSRIYTIADIGIGECAGEVVSLFSFEIAKAESTHFDALIALDDKDYTLAEGRAYKAMLMAARALIKTQNLDITNEADDIASEFKTRFYDTELIFDKFAKGKFARYFLNRHENPPQTITEDTAHQLIEEAQLFIENIHTAEARINGVIVG